MDAHPPGVAAPDDHPHAHGADHDDTPTYWRALEAAVRELLIAKGILTADEVRRQVEDMDARTPLQGARMVAHAWCDPDYRALLIADGNAACAALGIDRGPFRLVVVENTATVHNVIVCTLCSCYPRWLLGLPPAWYKSREYRARVVREPRTVLREFGTELPAGVELRVHDSTADMRYLVLPRRPDGTAGWPEEELAALVGRDAMIGVTVPAVPAARA
jgi:nitrile hydratase